MMATWRGTNSKLFITKSNKIWRWPQSKRMANCRKFARFLTSLLLVTAKFPRMSSLKHLCASEARSKPRLIFGWITSVNANKTFKRSTRDSTRWVSGQPDISTMGSPLWSVAKFRSRSWMLGTSGAPGLTTSWVRVFSSKSAVKSCRPSECRSKTVRYGMKTLHSRSTRDKRSWRFLYLTMESLLEGRLRSRYKTLWQAIWWLSIDLSLRPRTRWPSKLTKRKNPKRFRYPMVSLPHKSISTLRGSTQIASFWTITGTISKR